MMDLPCRALQCSVSVGPVSGRGRLVGHRLFLSSFSSGLLCHTLVFVSPPCRWSMRTFFLRRDPHRQR